jgi:signal transduction histidine kinase
LTSSIEEMVRKLASSSEISFSTKIAPVEGVLPKEQEINLYRIVQEALNNVVKHSQATRAWIEISRDEHQLNITVRDNGQGFDTRAGGASATRTRGFGMTGMAERVRMLGGSHVITSVPGEGTTTKINLRLQNGKIR